jgi:hypothetical protein
MQTLCLSRCQSAVSIYDSIPPPQGPEAPQGNAGGAIEYLLTDSLSPTHVTEPPQMGAHLEIVTLPGIERTIIPLLPEIPEEDVRERAEGAIEFLEE